MQRILVSMRPWSLCLLLALVTGFVYLNSFPSAFHFDDFPLLLENPRINGPEFSYGAFLDQYGGRPLTLWTFHWNYQLFGDDPFSYHLISVLLHAFVVVEIFLLILQLFKERSLAFVCALLFAVHPLQTQAVNYIWSRSVLLMAALGLLSLILARKHPWVALLCLQLAVWARFEAMVFSVPMIILNRDYWKSLLGLAAANMVAIVYSMLTYNPQEIGWTYPDPYGYWIHQSVAFWKYVSLMVWPLGLNLDHDPNRPEGWIVLLAGASFVGLCTLTLRIRNRYPVISLGFLWLVITLAPSLLIPNSDLINESRPYLALAGLALIVAWTFSKCRPNAHWSLSYGIIGVLLLFLVPQTMERNRIWTDDVALWQDTALKSPHKARTHYNLGVALTHKGENERAEAEFEIARTLDPGDDLSYAALGYCAELKRELVIAHQLYRKALQLNPQNAYAQSGVARVEKQTERTRG